MALPHCIASHLHHASLVAPPQKDVELCMLCALHMNYGLARSMHSVHGLVTEYSRFVICLAPCKANVGVRDIPVPGNFYVSGGQCDSAVFYS